jgi:hypothetical protein
VSLPEYLVPFAAVAILLATLPGLGMRRPSVRARSRARVEREGTSRSAPEGFHHQTSRRPDVDPAC